MKIKIHNHQNKASGLALALYARGHEFVSEGADVFLVDHDGPAYYRSMIDAAAAEGTAIVLYSHGGLSCVAWDGIWEPHPAIDLYLAISPGEAEIMRAYGYPNPIEVIGWYWCEQKPFRPPPANRVLFAPIHPLGNGYMRAEVQEANREAFEKLAALPIHLTVRYLGDLALNGLSYQPGVSYVEGRPDNSYADIDGADIVIASYTYAYLALARGKPVVMYAQDMRPWDGHSPETLRFAESWEKYEALARYPLDLADGPAVAMLERAASERPADWVQQHIGAPLDIDKVEAALATAIHRARSR